jgi:YVTN family beta-propeller protein
VARLILETELESLLATNRWLLSTRIEVGDKPEGISTHPQNDQLVYVANWFDDTVSLIDVSKLATIKTGGWQG